MDLSNLIRELGELKDELDLDILSSKSALILYRVLEELLNEGDEGTFLIKGRIRSQVLELLEAFDDVY